MEPWDKPRGALQNLMDNPNIAMIVTSGRPSELMLVHPMETR